MGFRFHPSEFSVREREVEDTGCVMGLEMRRGIASASPSSPTDIR
jgi:hypothetical protein